MKRLQKTIEPKPRPDVPRQLVIAFEAPQLWMMQPPERQRIVSSLANLLMQAAGDDPAAFPLRECNRRKWRPFFGGPGGSRIQGEWLVEVRGFEPLTSAVQAPARLTGSSLPFLRGSSATAGAGLSPNSGARRM